MITYNIDFDDKKYRKQLGDLERKMPQIGKRLLGKVSSEIRKDVRKTHLRNKTYKKISGNLYKNITYKTKSDFSAYITSNAIQSGLFEMGGTINAKENYLTFKIGEEWKKVKSITLPARPFLYPVINDYFTSNKAVTVMDTQFQKILEKMFE